MVLYIPSRLGFESEANASDSYSWKDMYLLTKQQGALTKQQKEINIMYKLNIL